MACMTEETLSVWFKNPDGRDARVENLTVTRLEDGTLEDVERDGRTSTASHTHRDDFRDGSSEMWIVFVPGD